MNNSSKARVTGGVDTHKDTHTAAALDENGQLLGVVQFEASEHGYRQLYEWLLTFGEIARVGVESTGSYGAGLLRHLRSKAVAVVEVNRPNRQHRRRHGKSDPADAEAAARAAMNGEATCIPKSQDGPFEALRHLRTARCSAIKFRTHTANQIHAIICTAPETVRKSLTGKTLLALVKVAAAYRASIKHGSSQTSVVGGVLRSLARRWLALNDEVLLMDTAIASYVKVIAPRPQETPGIGAETASTLLVAAGDNPERMKNEASFAALCGVSPIDASSGKQRRHRLNRSGNRDANRALWVIAFTRMRCDERTRAYAARRTKEGLSRAEILRCLKR